MNESIKTEWQTTLLDALNQKPSNNTISINNYLDILMMKFWGFQKEVEDNVNRSISIKELLEYLSKLHSMFYHSCMFFKGSSEILLFTIELEESNFTKHRLITNYNKAHSLVFNMAIDLITEKTKDVKYFFENNIQTEIIVQLSKYIRKSNKCKVIDIVELGYALYHTDFFINRTGEVLQLYDFIEKLGLFFGIEIKNVNHRIIELKNREQNPYKFLEQLLNSYNNSISIEI